MITQMVDKITDVKIVLLGDEDSGKGVLLSEYTESPLAIGVDFGHKNIIREEKLYRLRIWDTAGQERIHAVTKAYFKGASGFMIIFNVANLNSYNNVLNYIQEIRQYSTTVPFIIVGNRYSGLEHTVSFQQGETLAMEFNTTYMEVDSKESVNNAFDILLKNISEVLRR